MLIETIFERLEWLDQFPLFVEGAMFSRKPLREFPHYQQRFIVYTVRELGESWGHKYFIGDIAADAPNRDMLKAEALRNIATTWIKSLSSVPVTQLINGLYEIVESKTQYQKYPPRSVMEFMIECKRARPAYHEMYKPAPTGTPQIGFDEEAAFSRNERIGKTTCAGLRQLIKSRIPNTPENFAILPPDFNDKQEFEKLCILRANNQVCECGTPYYLDKSCPGCGKRGAVFKPVEPEEHANPHRRYQGRP